MWLISIRAGVTDSAAIIVVVLLGLGLLVAAGAYGYYWWKIRTGRDFDNPLRWRRKKHDRER